MDLAIRLRGSRTILGSTFFTAPFKVADISERNADYCRLMVMNASPGILDRDDYQVRLQLDPHTSLVLETQSYQRLYHMETGAMQYTEVRMAEGSRFTYLPHPTVPHEGARFKAVNKVYLQDNCRLIWGEVLTPGRGLQGEQFRYHHFQSSTELFIADRLAVKENLLIRPGSFDPMALGLLEGYSHQAGLLFLDPCGWDAAFQDILLQYLSSVSGVKFGVSRLPVPGLSVRLLGNKGELLFDCLKALAAALDSVSIQTKVYAR